MGGYTEGTWLIAGARTFGHGLLQWLETFVTAAGVGRHRLTAMNLRVNILSGASRRNCTNENRNSLKLFSTKQISVPNCGILRRVPQLRTNLLLETGPDEIEGKAIKNTGIWGPDYFAYVFVFLDGLFLCRPYKLVISEQAQVTLQLRVFSNYCKNF